MSKLKLALPILIGSIFEAVGLNAGIIGLSAKDGKNGKAGITDSVGPAGSWGIINKDKEIGLDKKIVNISNDILDLERKTKNLNTLDISRMKGSVKLIGRIVNDL